MCTRCLCSALNSWCGCQATERAVVSFSAADADAGKASLLLPFRRASEQDWPLLNGERRFGNDRL